MLFCLNLTQNKKQKKHKTHLKIAPDCLVFQIADRSTTKSKTFDPAWNESFIHEVTNAKHIGLTVFHDAAIPPDDFVANCTIAFEDLAHRDKESQDFWVSTDCLSIPTLSTSMYSAIYNFNGSILCMLASTASITRIYKQHHYLIESNIYLT